MISFFTALLFFIGFAFYICTIYNNLHMRQSIYLLLILVLFSFSFYSCEEKNDNKEKGTDNLVSDFLGVEGCGKNTTGGRGGFVYHVTNLDDNVNNPLPGSLRYVLNQPGAKNVVFDVSGVIELQSPLSIPSNTTLYGQSAPGDGICISGEKLGIGLNNPDIDDHLMNISGDNVIVQFLRFRMNNTLYDLDCFNCIGRNNVIIDHCSFSWSTDECVTCYGNTNFTMQWCMIYEGLNTDLKGNHGFGGIWGGSNASFHHNLIANQSNRCPRFDHDYVNILKGPVDFVNNVIYIVNSANGTYGGESCNTTGTQRNINMVNNYYKYSSSAGSAKGRILNPSTSCSYCTKAMGCSTIVPGKFYIAGNYVDGYEDKTSDNWSAVSPVSDIMKSLAPFAMSQEVSKQTAQDAYASVLAKAGASFARDAADERVISQVVNNTGTTVSGNSDIVFPTYNSGSKKTDSDNDGIPDEWEDANGIDKNRMLDGNTISPSGRTYLEEYMYSLVKDLY